MMMIKQRMIGGLASQHWAESRLTQNVYLTSDLQIVIPF